jgi:hypothetical protein
MQTKETKTAKELETKISSLLGGLEVTVVNDAMSGWTATVFGPPEDVATKFQQIGQIVFELHAKYDLKREPDTLVVGADLAPSQTTAPFPEPEDAACGEDV